MDPSNHEDLVHPGAGKQKKQKINSDKRSENHTQTKRNKASNKKINLQRMN
jgi:hypothetical protein